MRGRCGSSAGMADKASGLLMRALGLNGAEAG
jgi:hypothetical protein